MVIKEIVRLEDGRNIVLNLSEEEHSALLDFAVNFFMKQGWLDIAQIEPEFVEIDSTVESLKKETE
jgi:hypothetical protein